MELEERSRAPSTPMGVTAPSVNAAGSREGLSKTWVVTRVFSGHELILVGDVSMTLCPTLLSMFASGAVIGAVLPPMCVSGSIVDRISLVVVLVPGSDVMFSSAGSAFVCSVNVSGNQTLGEGLCLSAGLEEEKPLSAAWISVDREFVSPEFTIII